MCGMQSASLLGAYVCTFAAADHFFIMWPDRDFVLQIVGRQVVLAGNSIGGFISAGTAADHPGLCAGLVLVNR